MGDSMVCPHGVREGTFGGVTQWCKKCALIRHHEREMHTLMFHPEARQQEPAASVERFEAWREGVLSDPEAAKAHAAEVARLQEGLQVSDRQRAIMAEVERTGRVEIRKHRERMPADTPLQDDKQKGSHA